MLLPAVRWGWSAAARKRSNQKYCSFKFHLDVKLQLKSPQTNKYYLLVDQLTFSAELLKWFSKLRHCTFAPTVRCNDDKTKNYQFQTVCLVNFLARRYLLLIYFRFLVSFADQQDG